MKRRKLFFFKNFFQGMQIYLYANNVDSRNSYKGIYSSHQI